MVEHYTLIGGNEALRRAELQGAHIHLALPFRTSNGYFVKVTGDNKEVYATVQDTPETKNRLQRILDTQKTKHSSHSH